MYWNHNFRSRGNSFFKLFFFAPKWWLLYLFIILNDIRNHKDNFFSHLYFYELLTFFISLYLPVFLSQSMYLSLSLSLSLSIYLYLSIYLSIYLFLYLSLSCPWKGMTFVRNFRYFDSCQLCFIFSLEFLLSQTL